MAQLPFDKLKPLVESGIDATAAARASSERDRDYYDGHQWTDEEVAAIKRRKQPLVTINRIKRKIDAMVGIEQRSRTDPRAYPRHPGAEQAADVATKALVFVDDQTRFDSLRSAAFENMLVEGYGGVEVGAEEVNGQIEVTITRLRWEEIVFDPYSREKDFSDANWIGCIKWMTLDQAVALYGKEHEELLEAAMALPNDGDTYDDRPQNAHTPHWGDKRRRRVRVAQLYYRNGGRWYLSVFTGAGEIIGSESPYEDEHGNSTCPIVLMTAYIDRQNRRYGVVNDMISAQDEVNKRRSKLLHLLNTRQTSGVKGAVSARKVKEELAKPDGHVEVNPEAADMAAELRMPAFQVLPTNDMAAGQFQLLVESKDEIDKVGPNASLIGQLQGQQSGRAIMAQQQAGLVELAPIYDSLRDWTLRCYRAMWARVRQYWTDERWIRITDQFQAPEFIQINVMQGFDPFTMQPIIENAVALMDVDIVIDDAPDYATLQQETLEQLISLREAGVPVPPELIIEAAPIRNKARINEAIQEAQQQQAAMQQQGMAMQAQLEGAKAEADTQAKGARAARDAAQAEATAFDTFLKQRATMPMGF